MSPVRGRTVLSLLSFAALSLAAPEAARSAEELAAPPLQSALVTRAEGELATFYAHHEPLWVAPDGSLDPAAKALLALAATASLDGIEPAAVRADELAEAIRRAEEDGSAAALAEAELALSRTFADYVTALRRVDGSAMTFEHRALEPHAARPYFLLSEAASAPSLEEYVRSMGWMHPLYAPLRQALAAAGPGSSAAGQIALRNLERIRALPGGSGRYVLVATASAQLWMYEAGRVVDTMRVVVGKPETETPSYAGYIRHAIVNPYWNVPADLIRKTIAPRVLEQGAAYLRRQGYEVLSGWSDDAEIIDPATIDWRAVQRGDVELRVRQLPGAGNAMGQVKFEFPNRFGVYLHDTPDRDLLSEEARYFSSGCVRLEDAERLGRWLLGRDPSTDSSDPEQHVLLPSAVPVYVTYLTARADQERIALGPDPYRRDAAALAGGVPTQASAVAAAPQ